MAREAENNHSEAEARREAQDEILKDALGRGLTYSQAADLVPNTSARTVRRRMADEAFAREVRSRRSEMVSAVTGQLAAASTRAVEVLVECLGAEREADRIRAALAILQLSERHRAQSDLEAEIADLRRMLDGTRDHTKDDDESDPS